MSDGKLARDVGDATPSRAGPFLGWLERATARVPAALVPLAVGLAPIALPALATSVAMAAVLGGAIGAVADREAQHQFDSFVRMLERLRRRVSQHRADLSDEQVADLIARSDFLRFVCEARDRIAVAEFESRLDRFAAVVGGRIAGHGAAFDLDLHLARAALELGDHGAQLIHLLGEQWRRASGRARGPNEDSLVLPQFTKYPLERYFKQNPAASVDDVSRLAADVSAAERFALIEVRTATVHYDNRISCGDGQVVAGPVGEVALKPWGLALATRIGAPADRN